MKSGYICRKCVKKFEAEVVEGHICTSHFGNCSFCNNQDWVVHTSDYAWTNHKYLEEDREF